MLIRHRKLRDFARALRLSPVHAMGHLHALWHAALEQAEDGNLTSWSDEFIADSACYPGDAPQFVRLLRSHGWLDGNFLHDWLHYAGRYLQRKYGTSGPEKLEAIRKSHEDNKRHFSVTKVCLPESTVPTKPTDHAPQDARARDKPPTLSEAIGLVAAMRTLTPDCDYTDEETRRAWDSLEAGKDPWGRWMWGKHATVPPGDARAALASRIEDIRDRKPDRKNPNGNKGDSFWKDTKELEMVQKEIDAIKNRASETAMGKTYSQADGEKLKKLVGRKKELKGRLGL